MAMEFIFLISFYIINTNVQILLGGGPFRRLRKIPVRKMFILINWVNN